MKNTKTIQADGGVVKRSLVVEDSTYGGGAVFVGVNDAFGARSIGAHLTGTRVHDLIEALQPYAVKTPATVIDEDGDVWVEQEDGLFLMLESVGRTATLDEIEESYGIDDGAKPEIDPTGALVYVTGDVEQWGHGFEPGTLVEVVEGGDDLLVDGTYEVRVPGEAKTEYVSAHDLDLEAPRLPLFEVGDKVSGSFAYGKTEGEIRHVVLNGRGGFSGFYEVKVDGHTYSTGCAPFSGDGAGTFAETFLTKVEPLAEWERELLGMAEDLAEVTEVPLDRFYSPPALPTFPVRYAAGIDLAKDPAVEIWESIMKPPAIWQIPEGVEVGTLEPVVPNLEVGDRVQVIDATGSSTARLSDEATVERIVSRPVSGLRGPLVRVVTDDGRRYGMFASRFEKVIPSVWEPQVGDRARLLDAGGDRSSSASVGDEGEIVRIDDDLLEVLMDDGHSTARFAYRWEEGDPKPEPVTERDGFQVGDRVQGYSGATGRIAEFPSGYIGGDVLVAWETGRALAGSTLGAHLSALSPVCKICGPGSCSTPANIVRR